VPLQLCVEHEPFCGNCPPPGPWSKCEAASLVMPGGPIFESGSVFQPLFRSCGPSCARPALEALAYIGAQGLREECERGRCGQAAKGHMRRIGRVRTRAPGVVRLASFLRIGTHEIEEAIRCRS
jgi:hypothetical protein